MKKCFLAVITALSLAGFSYAQDDEEYEEEEVVYEEEEEAPAAKSTSKKQVVVADDEEDEEEADEAPAPKKAAKKKKASKPSVPNPNGTFGIGAELTGLDHIRLVYNLNINMSIVGILGFQYVSEDVPGRVHSDGRVDVTSESNWAMRFGAGFIYTMATPVLPMFGEGDLIVGTGLDDRFTIEADLFFGAKATVVKSLELAGQAGLLIRHDSWDAGTVDFSAMSIGLGARVYATWFFM